METFFAVTRIGLALLLPAGLLLAAVPRAAAATGASVALTSEHMPLSVEIRGKHYRLDGLMVRQKGDGRRPLVLLNHGICGRACRKKRSPADLWPQAEIFARWGYATYILMRRGNGQSDGPYTEGFRGCKRQDYTSAAHSAANDMVAVLRALKKLPYVDPDRIVAVGQSGGGIGVVALTAKKVSGLRAAINFAGGRGSSCIAHGTFDNKKEIEAFRSLGYRSRLPTLWIYTENDENWGPGFPETWHKAFIDAGGIAQFVLLPPQGRRGHRFFYRKSAITVWQPIVEKFLHRTVKP